MSGGCDTTPEERERWDAEARDRARQAEGRQLKLGHEAERIRRVAALLPPEHGAAKQWLDGHAAGLEAAALRVKVL